MIKEKKAYARVLLKKGLVTVIVAAMLTALLPTLEMKEVSAQESSAEEQCRQEIKEMLTSGDASEHNLSAYNLSYSQVNTIYNDLITGECRLAYTAYDGCSLCASTNGKIVLKVSMAHANNNFSTTYPKLVSSVNEIISAMPSGLSEADKALYLHDQLISKTVYKDGTPSSTAVGPLVYGYGICTGYADAYALLLNQVGIDSVLVCNNGASHTWNYVDVDGQWYHVDPTWDDSASGERNHTYFLLNDSEVKSVRSHNTWVTADSSTISSTSTAFADSYIRNVTGKMIYDNGSWYYADGNSIKANNMEGTEERTVYTADHAVTLSEAADGTVTYSCDGVTQTCSETPVLVSTTQVAAVAGTQAHFFLVKEGGSRTNYSGSNYIKLGDGLIKEAVKIQNDSTAIEANLLTIPDITKYVSDSQKVDWYSIKKEKDGWHVDGQIVSTNNTTATETTTATDTGTVAKFFLVKEGGSRTNYSATNYYSLGSGKIKEAVKIQNDSSAIEADLLTIPDTSKYVSATQSIVWYSIKKAGDGWHVDGQVVTSDLTDETQSVTQTETAVTADAEITAQFYLVKEGGSRTNYSATNYYSLGTGSIKEAKRIQDDEAAITANLISVPDASQYISGSQRIQWYSIKKAGDGWHVDGQIIDDAQQTDDNAAVVTDVEVPVTETATLEENASDNKETETQTESAQQTTSDTESGNTVEGTTANDTSGTQSAGETEGSQNTEAAQTTTP